MYRVFDGNDVEYKDVTVNLEHGNRVWLRFWDAKGRMYIRPFFKKSGKEAPERGNSLYGIARRFYFRRED